MARSQLLPCPLSLLLRHPLLLLLVPLGGLAEGPSPSAAVEVAWLGKGAVLGLNIEADVANVESHVPGHLFRQRHSAGEDAHVVEHTVTLLHGPLRARLPNVVASLRALAVRADADAGWGLAPAGGPRQFHLRCAKVIDQQPDQKELLSRADSTNLGWGDAGETLAVVAVPLAGSEADADGAPLAEVEVQRRGAVKADEKADRFRRAELAHGDALVWRGWDEFRVLPPRLTGSSRRLLLVEFWAGGAAAAGGEVPPPPDDDRAADSEAGLRQALSLDPSSAALLMRLGVALLPGHRVAEANSHLAEATRLAPDWDRPRAELGWVLAAQGKGNEAVSMMRNAVSLRPAFAQPRLGLVQLLNDFGKGEQALQEVKKAVQACPREAMPLAALADFLGTTEEGQDALMKAVQLEPSSAMLRHRLGLLHAERGDAPQKAEAFFQEALQLDPAGPAIYDLGVLQESTGRLEAAAVSYAAAAKAHPGDVRPLVNLGSLHVQAWRSPEAEQPLRAALAINPGDAKALDQLAEVRRRAKDPEEAVKLLRRAVRKHPTKVHFRLRLAASLPREAEKERTKLIAKAVKLAPGSAEAHFMLAQLHEEQDRLAEAAGSLKAALAIDPENAEAQERLQEMQEELLTPSPSLYRYGDDEDEDLDDPDDDLHASDDDGAVLDEDWDEEDDSDEDDGGGEEIEEVEDGDDVEQDEMEQDEVEEDEEEKGEEQKEKEGKTEL